MQVVILCGGLGERLREETEFRPKPMIEIGGKPILWHIMKIYAHYGFTEFILPLGYKGQIIRDYFLNYNFYNNDALLTLGKKNELHFHSENDIPNWKITFVETGKETPKGSRIKKIEKYVEGDTFMLTYGDGVANIDIAKLLDFHKSHGKIGTVTSVKPPSRFGELHVEKDRVINLSEKPLLSHGFVNGGFFVFQRSFFDYLTEMPTCDLEQDALARLAQEGQLMTYKHEGFWQCMDTYRELQLLNNIWESGAPWKVWKQ